jgi:WD40 repeat protein
MVTLRKLRSVQMVLWSIDGLLIKTIEGHNEVINDTDFSPDSKMLATGSSDNTIRLTKEGGENIILRGHKARVTIVHFSPDGKMLVSASGDAAVKLWNIEGKELMTLQEPIKEMDESDSSTVENVQFSSDSKNVFIVGNGKMAKVRLLDIQGKELRIFKSASKEGAVSADFDRNNKSMAIVDRENALKLWSREGNLLNVYRGHTSKINASSFSGDSKFLASASDDKTVKIWKNDGTLVKSVSHEDKVNSVSFSSDSKFLASASDDKTVKIWKNDGTLVKSISHEDKVNSVSFSSDSKLLASASDDKTVKIWKNDGTLVKSVSHEDKVKLIKFSPDSNFLASASRDGIVKIWSSGGKEVAVIKGNSNSQPTLRFSPDSKILVIHDSQYDSDLKFYIIDSVWAKNSLVSLNNGFSDFSFTPDNKSIAIAAGNEVKFLDLTLDSLLGRSCSWLQDYLKNNPNVDKDDRKLCDDIPIQK